MHTGEEDVRPHVCRLIELWPMACIVMAHIVMADVEVETRMDDRSAASTRACTCAHAGAHVHNHVTCV